MADAAPQAEFALEALEEVTLGAVYESRVPSFARLAPGHAARTTPRLWADNFSAEMQEREFLRASPPPLDLVAIPGAELRSDFMAYADDRPICSTRLYPGYVNRFFASGRRREARRFPNVEQVTTHDRPLYVVTHFNMLTYGHFLLEVLPKLFLIKSLYEQGFDYPIAAPKEMGEGFAAIFKAVHPGFKIVSYAAREARLRTPLALLPSVMTSRSFHFHDAFITGVKTLTASLNPPAAAKRFFISREGWRSFRRLSNEAELSAIAAARGFNIVKPQELTWPDQIRLFASASHIVGEFTSALHNTMFSTSEARVLALNWLNPAQGAIADSMGHALGFAIPIGGPSAKHKPGWTEPEEFRIDPADFRARLEQLLA